MSLRRTRTLVNKYASSLAYIEVERVDGSKNIGSCFHVGEGVFVTARHVVEGHIISEVKIPEPVAVTASEFFDEMPEKWVEEYNTAVGKALGKTPMFNHFQSALALDEGPYYHPDPDVDVAIFRVANLHPETAVVLLGDHLDDWIKTSEWRLSGAAVLGFPPIPLTDQPHLVVASAEVNAVVDLYSSRHVHFILSAVPRGGFSGGLALSEYGFALGLVTQSLVKNNSQEESGFLAVLSVEPIYECLSQHKLLPLIQESRWGDFWNTFSTFCHSNGRLIVSLDLIEDGGSIGFGICSYDRALFNTLISVAKDFIPDNYSEVKVRDLYTKYLFSTETPDIRQVICVLLPRLLGVCRQHGLVVEHDEITPELAKLKQSEV